VVHVLVIVPQRAVPGKGITTKQSITDAIYAAGFNTTGRFYEKSTKILGMTPKELRAGGKGKSIRFAIAECSLGPILIGATNQGVRIGTAWW